MIEDKRGALLLVALMGIAAFAHPTATEAHGHFSDVPENHWAAAVVNELAERGILRGYPASPARKPVNRSSATPPRARRQTSPAVKRAQRSGRGSSAVRRPGRR